MADLPHVKQGQDFWTVPFNTMIDFYNAVGGGTVQHLVNPLSFINGTTGHSEAWVAQAENCKFVFLVVTDMRPNKDAIAKYQAQANIPDNLAPAGPIRLQCTQNIVMANGNGGNSLIVWATGEAGMDNDMFGSVLYVSNN